MKKRPSILYNIFIPQERIQKIAPKLSLDAAVILDYISRWQLWSKAKSKTMIFEGEEFKWLHYPTLKEGLPILRIRSTARISRRIDELKKYGLLKKQKLGDNTVLVRLTDLAASLFSNEPLVTKSDQPGDTVSPDLVIPCDQHNTNINNTFSYARGSSSKEKKEPGTIELIEVFIKYCKGIKGFTPVISWGVDGKMAKRRLQEFTFQQLEDELDWFLKSNLSDRWTITFRTALCDAAINQWQKELIEE